MSFIGSSPKFDRPSTKKKAFFFEHARMTQTFCKWKRGDMKVRIHISCGNAIQTKACVSSFVLFCAILAPNYSEELGASVEGFPLAKSLKEGLSSFLSSSGGIDYLRVF